MTRIVLITLLLAVLVGCGGGRAARGVATVQLYSESGQMIKEWENVSKILFDPDDPWVSFRAKDETYHSVVGTMAVHWQGRNKPEE